MKHDCRRFWSMRLRCPHELLEEEESFLPDSPEDEVPTAGIPEGSGVPSAPFDMWKIERARSYFDFVRQEQHAADAIGKQLGEELARGLPVDGEATYRVTFEDGSEETFTSHDGWIVVVIAMIAVQVMGIGWDARHTSQTFRSMQGNAVRSILEARSGGPAGVGHVFRAPTFTDQPGDYWDNVFEGAEVGPFPTDTRFWY